MTSPSVHSLLEAGVAMTVEMEGGRRCERLFPPEKEITKRSRRPGQACERCRAGKRRCDGLYPCQRCQAADKTCIYPPPKSKKDKSIPNEGPETVSQSDSFLVASAQSRMYIDIFFNRIYGIRKLMNIDMRKYERPTDKAILLQFYSAAASTRRAFGNLEDNGFEGRARSLASELFDDISEETALGFHLLSYLVRSRDSEKGIHFREIASSMSRQLLRSHELSTESRSRLIGLEVMNQGLRPIYDPEMSRTEFDRVARQARQVVESGLGSESVMRDLMAFFSFGYEFRRLFEETDLDPSYGAISLRNVSPEQLQELSKLIDGQVGQFIRDMLIAPSHSELTSAFSAMGKAVILYAGHCADDALKQLYQSIGVIEKKLHIFPSFSSMVAELFHLSFLVAYSCGENFLASTFHRFESLLANFVPASQRIVDRDSLLLQSMNSCQTNHLMDHSFLQDLDQDQDHRLFGSEPPQMRVFEMESSEPSPLLSSNSWQCREPGSLRADTSAFSETTFEEILQGGKTFPLPTPESFPAHSEDLFSILSED